MSRPCAAMAASVKRSASAPYSSISARGSMTLPLDFDIFCALLVAHEGVDVDVVERHLLHEVRAHHHHARDPEEDDVEAGDERAGRDRSASAPSSPPASPASRTATAPRRTRCRARPRRARSQRHSPTVDLRSFGLSLRYAIAVRSTSACASFASCGNKHLPREDPMPSPSRPVPRRDLMAPPELARDAPGLDVAHPLEVGLLPVLRHEPRLAVLDRGDRLLRQLGGVRRTTGRSATARRRRCRAARAARRASCGSIFSTQAQRLEVGDDALARLEAVEAAILLRHARR